MDKSVIRLRKQERVFAAMAGAFEEHLISAFPEATWRPTLIAVKEGVALADDLRDSVHWLGSLVGGDLLGSLRRAGVMWRLRQLCSVGDLPFQCVEVENTIGSAHLVQITSGSVRAHVTRTETAKSFPSDMPIRQDHRLTYNSDLFNDIGNDGKVVSIAELLQKVPAVYAWLTFGADRRGGVSHVCWGAPAAEGNIWLAHINLLRRAGDFRQEEPNPDVPKRPDPRQAMKFKADVEEQLRRNMNVAKNDSDSNE